MRIRYLTLGLGILSFLIACTDHPADGSLKIILKENKPVLQVLKNLFYPQEIRPLGNDPGSLSQFNCFMVNVTTPEPVLASAPLPPYNLPNHCTPLDNFMGAGKGVLSIPTARGQPISMIVSAGPSRRFDVYAGYPSLTQCGGPAASGRSSWYHVGSTTKEITTKANQVEVTISYEQGQPVKIACLGTTPVVPTADDKVISTYQDTPFTGTLTGSDPEEGTLTFSIVSQGAHGTVSITSVQQVLSHIHRLRDTAGLIALHSG